MCKNPHVCRPNVTRSNGQSTSASSTSFLFALATASIVVSCGGGGVPSSAGVPVGLVVFDRRCEAEVVSGSIGEMPKRNKVRNCFSYPTEGPVKVRVADLAWLGRIDFPGCLHRANNDVIG